MLVLGFMVACAGTLGVEPASAPSVDELEKAALQQRRAIVRGSANLKSMEYKNGSATAHAGFIMKLWLEPSKSRRDLWWLKGAEEKSARQIDCRNCERNGYNVLWDETELPSGTIVVSFVKMGPEYNSPQRKLLDLRMLGLVPVHVNSLTGFHLESYLTRTDRDKPTVKRDVWKGQECWLIQYVDVWKSNIHIWICPQKGNSVVRMISEDKGRDGVLWLSSIESTVESVGRSGLWFPSLCVFERIRDGKPDAREVLEITDLSLNEPIPPEVFSLAGMDIKDGTTISGVPELGSWHWKDGQIQRNTAAPRFPGAISSESTWRKWVAWIGVGAALLSACFFVLYIARRRRNTTAN